MDVALPKQDVVDAADLHLGAILGVEEHAIAGLERPHVLAHGDDLGPGQPLPHFRGRWNDDARGGATLALGGVQMDQHPVMKHSNGKLLAEPVVDGRSACAHERPG
jgi:hypothetical protein